VLATSDKDMIPLARIAKQRGAAVVVLGSDLTAIPLVEMSNVFITYRQLLRELDRVSELEAPVGRAPARERRLRESRRPSSEPYVGGLGSGTGFGGQIGAGGRGGPRPVGAFNAPPAPPTPLPAPSVPRRRYPEPAPVPMPAVIEPERATVAVVPPAPIAPVAEPITDPLSIGSADVAPRRRRRRGGRGRRTGIGGLGEGELQGDSLLDGVDDLDEVEAEDDDQAPVVAASSSPDDIDNAVLQLLAARDREQLPSAAAEAASLAEEPAISAVTPEPAVVEVAPPPAPEPYTPRRRAVRTSFSSFGPPEINFRPAAPAQAQPEPPAAIITTVPETTDEPSASAGASWAPAEPAAEAVVEASGPAEGAAPEHVVAEPIPASSAADATPETGSNGVTAGDESVEGSAPAASSRPARSSRSGRTGSTRRTRGSSSGTAAAATSATAATSESGSADEGSGDAARAPRRRRTRRPASAAAEGLASEGLAAEAPSEAVVTEASF
jgi:hypothetical protein